MARSFYGRTGLSVEDTLSDGLASLSETVRERVIEAVTEGAELIAQRAHDKANVSPTVQGHAVDGTHMRDNIEIDVQESDNAVTAKVFIDQSNVPYAAHQEFGPRGKPFMRPAFDESRAEVHQIMRNALPGGVRGRTAVRFRRFA